MRDKRRVLRFYHEWVQALPLIENTVVCLKCEERHKIGSRPWPKGCKKGELVPVSWLPLHEQLASFNQEESK